MFTKEYWVSSFKKFKSVRYLSIMGFLIALRFVLEHFRIPVSENLNIMFTYVPAALEAMIIGPGAGIITAAVSDLLSGFLAGYGPFFPGYMVSKIVSALIYGLFFYRTKVSLKKIAFAKAINNYLVNVCLGSLWNSILYGKAFVVYASASLVKNTILLPVEVTVLYLLFKALIPYLSRRGIIKDTTI